MTLSAGRDGGLTNMEVMGMMTLHIRDEQMAKVRLRIQGTDNKNIQMQTHPNIDKELFKSRGLIGLNLYLVAGGKERVKPNYQLRMTFE